MLRSLFYIGMTAICLLGCSQHEWELTDTPEAQTEESGKAFLTLSLSVPQATESRSQTNLQGGTGSSNGTENSWKEECQVTDAWVVLGRITSGQQNPIIISQKYYVDKFHPTGNQSQWSATIPCQPGSYRVAVIANPGHLFSVQDFKPGDPWEEVIQRKIQLKEWEVLKNIWKDQEFLMTNAYQGNPTENDIELVENQHRQLTVHVQRICARFDYEPRYPENRYNFEAVVDGSLKKVTVQLQEAGLMNVSNNFNLFKHVTEQVIPHATPQYTAFENKTNYVYDSDWSTKWDLLLGKGNATCDQVFFFPSEQSASAALTDIEYHPLALPTTSTGPQTTEPYDALRLTYATENTLPGELFQINQLSTGVVFKGSFQVSTVQALEIYYRSYNGYPEIFTSLEKLREAEPHLPTAPSDSELAQAGIRVFRSEQPLTGQPGPDGQSNPNGQAAPDSTRYPVWFTYWNRHNDNGNPHKMGIMEFAVVRNNIYKLKVNSIGSLGLPLPPNDPKNPWKPQGDTPDEALPHLDVTVNIQPWVVREWTHEI